MSYSHRTLPKWFTHLSLAGFTLVFLTSAAYADPSHAQPQSPHAQAAPHGTGHPSGGVMAHPTNYEGYGSAHGSTHPTQSHGAYGASPHGGGHSGGYSSGHGAHDSGHPGPHQSASEFIDHVLKFKEGMGITDQQEVALRTLETNFKKTKIKLKAESDLASLELHELLRNDKASMSAIETKLKNVHEVKANLYLASIKARREAKAVLSDEQRSRMETIHERIKNHGSKMKGYSDGKSPHGKISKQGN